mgnify:CR=1 FL=1
MGKFVDLSGQRFDKLCVIEKAEDLVTKEGRHFYRWKCLCDCGEEYITYESNLLSDKVHQCRTCRYKQTANSNRQLNSYKIYDNYIIGLATNGSFIIDKDSYDLIKDYTWYLNKAGYVITQKNRETIYLHRLVLGLPNKVEIEIVDHVNGERNDNRKQNLRVCLSQDNNKNFPLRKDNKTGPIPGVVWEKDRKKWKATLRCDKKQVLLKRFNNVEDAIVARIKAELKYFGEHSRRYKQYQQILDQYQRTGVIEIQTERYSEEN